MDVESEDRNHVEIGVNSSIGRGSLRDAAAGDDSKIDYLVQGFPDTNGYDWAIY
ncbi:hypothetical protein OROMI_012443 [Orobanche minor]